jgi:glycosyltransferase involved in cell wall biosynthesis
MNNELISVVIPSYNRGHVILKSVNSILDQTYKNIELIIVDDGSTDDTTDVLKLVHDDRLRVLKLDKNYGMCFARNAGAAIATGTYIACHDSDDIWDKIKLEKQYNFMKDNNYDLSFCRMLRITENGKKNYIPSKKFKLGENVYQQLLIENFVASITIIMKKNVSDVIQFDPNVKRFTDWDFALRVFKAGFIVGYLPEILVTSYIQKDSTCFKVKLHDSIKFIYERFNRDIDDYPPAKARYMYVLGCSVSNEQSSLAMKYFQESLKIKFSWNALIRLILLKLGLLDLARSVKNNLQ